MFCCYLDFQQSNIILWKEVREFKDPQLERLAQALPQTVMQARAKSTTDKYARAYQHWKEWAEEKHADGGFPVNVALFALYLQHVGEKGKSRAAISEAVYAVSWVQRLAGEEPVSQNPLIKVINEGFQRSLAQPKKKKEPVTPEMLREVVASFGASLAAGQVVPVASTGNPTCPVAMLRRYIDLGGIDTTSTLNLFRPICSTRKGESLRAKGSLSYSRIRELVLSKFKQLGYNPAEFGLHSFRAGGATRTANFPGLPERLFKHHGRWKSERAKYGYVKDPLEKRLRVSKSLGL